MGRKETADGIFIDAFSIIRWIVEWPANVRLGTSNEHARMFDSIDSTRIESNTKSLFEKTSRTENCCSRGRVEQGLLLDRDRIESSLMKALLDRCSTRNARKCSRNIRYKLNEEIHNTYTWYLTASLQLRHNDRSFLFPPLSLPSLSFPLDLHVPRRCLIRRSQRCIIVRNYVV